MADKKAIVIENGVLSEIAPADELDPQNLTNYFQKSEYVDTSAGAGNAGDPAILDASGKWDVSMIPATGGGTTTINTPFVYASYLEENTRNFDHMLHGGLYSEVTGEILNSGSDINLTKGIAKLYIVINAGVDFTGSLTITGTSVDRDTQVQTPLDTDVISITTLSNDTSSTDAEGNPILNIADGYISSKWFTGAITISTTDLDLSDVDVYSIMFDQANSNPDFTITEWDFSTEITNTTAWFYGYFYTVDVNGGLCDVINQASFAIPSGTATIDVFRKREQLNINLDGSTDGFFVDLFFGPGALSYFQNLNHKITIVANQDVSATLDHGGLSGLSDDDHLQYHNDARGDVRYTQRSNNLSDVSSALTSFNNIKQSATDSFEGVVELATSAEVGTGTDDTKAVTPLGYKNNLLASNVGYTPSTLSDWDGGIDPGETDDALDQLVDRVNFVTVGAAGFQATNVAPVASSFPPVVSFVGAGFAWIFPDASFAYVGTSFVANRDGTTIDVYLWWAMDTATTGNVQLTVFANSFSSGGVAASGPGVANVIAVPGVAQTLTRTLFSISRTFSKDDILMLDVRGDRGFAADTATGDLYFVGVEVRYS